MLIYPIIIPDVHWSLFLVEARNLTGDSLSRTLDAHNVKPRQDQSIIAAFCEFQRGCSTDPLKEIRESESVLQHLSFSFLCECENEVMLHLTQHTDLALTISRRNPNCWIVSGNLLQWRRAVVLISQIGSPYECRLFANSILVLFQCSGYSQVWEGYAKHTLDDQTFTLRPK